MANESNKIQPASPETIATMLRSSAKVRIRVKGKPPETGEVYQGQVKIQGCKTCR